MMVIGQWVRETVQVFISIQMGLSIKGVGKMIFDMEMELWHGPTAMFITENGNMEIYMGQLIILFTFSFFFK